MSFVSITRLRLRSIRFFPAFLPHTLRSIRQIKAAPGFKGGSLLADRQWTFWTMTLWDNEDSMRRYMTEGSHRTAMPLLLDWCDEASVAHWTQTDETLPSWSEADARMRRDGRASKVRHPSADHAALTYRPPRTVPAASIHPAR